MSPAPLLPTRTPDCPPWCSHPSITQLFQVAVLSWLDNCHLQASMALVSKYFHSPIQLLFILIGSPRSCHYLIRIVMLKKTPASSNEEVVTIWDPWLKCECRSYHRFCWFRGKKSLQTQVLARALQLAAVSEADQAVGSSEACVLLEGMESSQVASRYSLCDGRMWGCGPALPPLPSLGSAKN